MLANRPSLIAHLIFSLDLRGFFLFSVKKIGFDWLMLKGFMFWKWLRPESSWMQFKVVFLPVQKPCCCEICTVRFLRAKLSMQASLNSFSMSIHISSCCAKKEAKREVPFGDACWKIFFCRSYSSHYDIDVLLGRLEDPARRSQWSVGGTTLALRVVGCHLHVVPKGTWKNKSVVWRHLKGTSFWLRSKSVFGFS